MNIITEDIKEVLLKSRVEKDKVFLPAGLDRKVYMAVNLHLENSGGKWNKGLKCHVFAKGTEKLQEGISAGKTINEQQEYQSFFTPSSLAARLVEIGKVNGKDVLEPSAGVGNLVKECLAQGARFVSCIELNREYADELASLPTDKGLYSIRAGVDFLETPLVFKYDRVCMNPPFTKNQWLKHLFYAFEFLKPGGKLVAILPDSRQNSKLIEFLGNKNYTIHEVEKGSFKETGTMVNVMILEINN